MKKVLTAVLAIAAMAACTKSNVEFNQQNEIAFQPVTQKATKAAVVGTNYPTDEAYNFKVWAWWAEAGKTNVADFNTVYINDQEFTHKENVVWGGVTPYYWPTTGSLYFAGYSPASVQKPISVNGQTVNSISYNKDSKILTATAYEQSSDISNTVDFMWFHLTDQSYDRNTESVPVKFHHALSWLSFRFNLQTSATPKSWTVKSVKLTGIETKGNFTATKGATANEQGNAYWDEWDETKEVQVYSNATGYTVTHVTTPYSPTADDRSVLENTKNGVIVIPQPCAPADAKVVIEFQQVAPSGAIVPQTKTLDLGKTGDAWLPGKHYIYTVTFGAEEILIAPTVVDWDPVSDLAVPVI